MKREMLKFMILSVMSLFTLEMSAQMPIDKCLRFTANEDGSTVKLIKTGSPYEFIIQYSTDGGTSWTDVDFTSASSTGKITLAKVGDKVYFRKKETGLAKGFSKDPSNHYYFAITGSVAASGSIMSLIDGYTKTFSTKIPCDYCFCGLFSGCEGLTTAPELTATQLTKNCYDVMFACCKSLTTAPELPAKELADGCYAGMFSNCTSLNSITVKFTSWGMYSPTLHWMDEVSSTGTFVCPSSLDKTQYGENYIPSGWTVNGKLYVSVSSIGWASLYYDKALEIPTGVKAYYASAASGSTVTLTEITGVIPAETAVIISAAEGEVQFPLYTGTAPDAIKGNLFKGVLTETTNPGDVYVLDGNATTTSSIIFNNYTGTTLGARKAYLPKSALSSPAKDINFVFEGEATSIDKVDVNGQQSTVNSIFNLAGQKVGADYKGIVIVNGKKFIKQ